jgi:hypothetical protein
MVQQMFTKHCKSRCPIKKLTSDYCFLLFSCSLEGDQKDQQLYKKYDRCNTAYNLMDLKISK